MNRQPDKIFREKLGAYDKPVSPEAWKRVQENLGNREVDLPWLKIAATILLLAVAGILLFPVLTKHPGEEMAESSTPVETEKPLPQTSDTTEEGRAATTEVTRPVSPPPSQREHGNLAKKGRMPRSSTPEKTGTHSPDERVAVITETHQMTVLQLPEPVDQKDMEATGPSGPAEKPEVKKHMTIVFTADEVNEKYLEKNSVAEATPEGNEPSTLRKLLEKAYDLKSNQNPLGELRQKKNEILALNFKSDKQRMKTN